jgi:V/A-type H+-transporting ATPase subunit A
MLDETRLWDFVPSAKVGDRVSSASKIGSVKEYMVDHYIMVPYELKGDYKVVEISPKGKKRIDDVVAKIEPVEGGKPIDLTMTFPASIKKQIAFGEMIIPEKQLETRMRTVDFLMPVPLGGTFCVPGPFGAGKTVLQHLLAKNSQVDIVVVAACGERAGEVVEMLVEFPEIKDPRTGGSLMDRTIIICNTSSMPVAAREASVYTATAISEHYRQMGLNVLLLADSTSRWAQALRELSGRMEEIPGEEAFPAYMESLISQFYGRAGTLVNGKGEKGSLTIGGTVSPAGGNFQEPVTQGTLKVVDAFLGLSRERSDAAKYPAIHPVESWSTYTGSIHKPEYLERIRSIILDGVRIEDKLKVMEQSDISDDDFTTFKMYDWFDSVFLQQNAFDEVDASCVAERQQEFMEFVMKVVDNKYSFKTKDDASQFFAKLGSLMIDFNVSPFRSDAYNKIKKQAEEMVDKQGASSDAGAA